MAERPVSILWLPLKPELDLETGDSKQIWDQTLTLLTKQRGASGLFWSRQVETPTTVIMVVEWTSPSDFDVFAKEPDYKTFHDNLTVVLADSAAIFHAKLPHSSEDPLVASVTECIAAYLSPSQSEEEYMANFKKFGVESAKIPETQGPGTGFRGFVGGFCTGTHQHESLGEGVQGKVFAAFIGWPNMETHMEFRKVEAVAKIVPLLRGGVAGWKIGHANFVRYQ